ncbi:phenazine biosynthesis protein [Pandoraea faecigallinarum]|uniref:Phenazine biosynthesis protein n=1 Tax=Pandoraea faecigallinarum TaxID=656179 RepID=A0A0H3WS99_9BURK|nr:PhzF family phenazine biosynthesis isomerase [Pandoraea faecigallinarum]AKM29431.1 phenazine biosynthesis protein [Pandoraea faecigallinarum]
MSSHAPLSLRAPATISLVSVFPAGDNGGNPAPIVLDADAMTSGEMRAVAAHYGHESAFVMNARAPENAWRFRFFVPNHEMEMCGHATLGALWVLRRGGRWDGSPVTIETLSGRVQGRLAADGEHIEVSQPAGRTEPVVDASAIAAICATLRIAPDDIALEGVCNAATSRVKTLVPLRSIAQLQALCPDFTTLLATCDAIGSTGLYPCAREAVEDGHALPVLQARQFPRSSGYPEDAATGIAAAALLYGARRYGWLAPGERGVVVRQGVAMGRPSAITVTLRDALDASAGCWISGDVHAI